MSFDFKVGFGGQETKPNEKQDNEEKFNISETTWINNVKKILTQKIEQKERQKKITYIVEEIFRVRISATETCFFHVYE